ncbi:uncharacterized protein L969DRAFT_83821 [Mixia osmundae IAM 14324]|uniref:Major facilitator superfamily (MFS) profile domain-containing protein n=1 Tax=Mixia osmundae (strain CBS 9802 / IAM 14324 / JCM 22182 / KY 12970) TaxID=764103 RepID=G7E3W5_MIXOS|nr:uncharacterized protein L969DRAFT_83821 [Mixia osmundae IAM 14324]KEI41970.1 hypothetical protein L969DRAFT_83821 [Mixia osmundae IAM 14324]GAA97525.1 hypothetical protein E5Q_04203 [Mixia osmundae IAM 14324]
MAHVQAKKSHTSEHQSIQDIEQAAVPTSEKSVAPSEDDAPYDKPVDWTFWKKFRVNAILCFATLSLTYSSSAFASSVPDVELHFRVSRVVAILPISLFVLGFAVGPLLFGPLSNVFGRRPVYVWSYLLFTICQIGAALSPNIGCLIALRFLSGVFGCSSLNNVSVSVAEFTEPRERLRWLIWYGFFAFGGPVAGPLCGNFIAVKTRPIPGTSNALDSGPRASWRWNFWIMAMSSALAFILLVVESPETCGPILQQRANVKRATEEGREIPRESAGHYINRVRNLILHAMLMPVKLAVCEPLILACSFFFSLLYGIIYGLFAGLPYVFEVTHGWKQDIAGLPYIALGIGFLAGALAIRIPGEIMFGREVKRVGGPPPPEARLKILTYVVPLTPISLFIFGFTTYTNIHWFPMMIGLALFSFSTIIVFVSLIPYLLASYQSNAADALAIATFSRSCFAAAFPLFMFQAFETLSPAGACGLLAGVSIVLVPLPWLLMARGPAIRARSRYAVG